MADGVGDAAVGPAQNQVAVPPHHFAAEHALGAIAQLVRTGKHDFQDTVAVHLAHVLDAAAAQKLAQQHAEHRRLVGVGLDFLRDVRAGAVGGGAQEQTPRAFARAYEHMQFVLFRLQHAVHAAARQHAFEFPGHKAQHQPVHFVASPSVSNPIL